MKRMACLAAGVFAVVMLAGCGQESSAPVWTGTLENTGVVMTVTGASVAESTAFWYQDEDSDGEELLLLTAEDVVKLCWQGLQPENVEVAFATPDEGVYYADSEYDTIEKVDYVPLDGEEGVLAYRFDTAYSFIVTVTTEQGTDRFLLDARRDI